MIRRFRDERSEAGETLIEVLMSSTLMAIIVVAVIGGIATVILSSKLHREQATTNTALVQVVEALKAADLNTSSAQLDHVPCALEDNAGYVDAAEKAAVAAGFDARTIKITDIKYQKVTTSGGSPAVTWDSDAANCEDDGSALTLQLVTLELADPDGNVAPTMTFVKGDNR